MGILLNAMKDFDSVEELKSYYEQACAGKEHQSVKACREIVEGYFISGETSEEDFLQICDEIDNNLYDDYKDLYEEEPWFIDLRNYTENLQRLTGKKPCRRNREWMYLKIKTEQN